MSNFLLEIIIVIEDDDEEERAPEEESCNEPENDFLAFHRKRMAEKKRRASAANESFKTKRPSNQNNAEDKKIEHADCCGQEFTRSEKLKHDLCAIKQREVFEEREKTHALERDEMQNEIDRCKSVMIAMIELWVNECKSPKPDRSLPTDNLSSSGSIKLNN